MGKQEFHAIQCSHCGLHQVQQVKKNPQFKCTVCNKQQKLREEHFRGPAKQCREVVQGLNQALKAGDIPSTPISEEPTRKPPMNSSGKRKSASDPGGNDQKRLKNTKLTRRNTQVETPEKGRMSSDDDELFPPEDAGKLPLSSKRASLSDTSPLMRLTDQSGESRKGDIELKGPENSKYESDDDDDDDIFGDIPSPKKRVHSEAQSEGHGSCPSAVPNSSSTSSEQPLATLEGSGKEFFGGVQTGTNAPMDDDDDIFDDIPSPPTLLRESVSGRQFSTSSTAQEVSPESSVQLLPQNGQVIEKSFPTENKKSQETSVERGGEANDKNARVTVSRTVEDGNTGKTSEEVESIVRSNTRVSSVKKIEVEGVPRVQEAWRRRSLTKLAKFKFDPDDDFTKEETIEKAMPSVTNISPAVRTLPESGAPSKTRVTSGTSDSCLTKPDTTKVSPEALEHDQNLSSPGGGRDRLLATLQRFKRAPTAK